MTTGMRLGTRRRKDEERPMMCPVCGHAAQSVGHWAWCEHCKEWVDGLDFDQPVTRPVTIHVEKGDPPTQPFKGVRKEKAKARKLIIDKAEVAAAFEAAAKKVREEGPDDGRVRIGKVSKSSAEAIERAAERFAPALKRLAKR